MATNVPRYSPEDVLHPTEAEVNTFEELYAQKVAQGTIHHDHRVNFYQVFRFQGEGNAHYVEGKEIALSQDCLLVINRNVMHRYAEQKCNGCMVLFSDTFFGGTHEKIEYLNTCTLLQGGYVVVPLHSPRTVALVDFYFEQMRKLRHERKILPLSTLIVLRNWLHILLLTAEREYLQHNSVSLVFPSNTDDHMQRFRNLLDAHCKEHKHVGFYSSQLGLTEKQLSRTVRNMHGISAKAYITERILQEAVWMLKNTTLNQGEIANALGFDFTYFVKFFRRHTGITPAKHRQRLMG